MSKGIVKFFNRKSKFGFIREIETGSEYYVHVKDVTGSIDEGDEVTFDLKNESRGPAAVNVIVTSKSAPKTEE
jgi:CspA family cold shock protein